MKKSRDAWYRSFAKSLSSSGRWLIPGLGVKRWILVIFIGTTFIAVGAAFILLEVYRNASGAWWTTILSTVALQELARIWRALIFGSIGIGVIIWGLMGMNRAIMAPYTREGDEIVKTLASFRRRERGPRIVVIGGGHGLATLLRGLKAYTHNITAVVSVADDGGSSGRIRRSMGIPPPGDIRNCLAALSSDEALLGQLFQYRFPLSDEVTPDDGLEGHSFGNLFISALAEITGSFEEAVAESGRVLAVHGKVLPACLHEVRLVADVVPANGTHEVRVEGESRIPQPAGKVRRVWLDPEEPPAYPGVIQAILSADLIIIGPGSLYTSILPNLLVPDIAAAVRTSRCLKLFVCNVATQRGETDGYTCGDHIRAIEEHVGSGFFDVVVSNGRCEAVLPPGTNWVITEDDLKADHLLYQTDLVDPDHPWRHDSRKLAQVIIDLHQEKTGPLVE